MLAKSHRLMAASGAVLLGAPPLGIAAAVLGATLPDRVEIVGLPHRGISHWPWPWALAVWFMTTQGNEWASVVAWWFAGALLHIGADMFTVGGIPLLLPNWRIRLGPLRTGEFGESLVVAVFVLAAVMHVLRLQLVRVGGP
ncbi:MAG: metal-dependent hydrolase [Deltaproteobacteria bacterium]|nr:metal-dependent hydrolase [Deltaproteobacteria bacterium]